MKREQTVDSKLKDYARLYGDGKVSLARTAKEAGVSLWEMMDYARSRRVCAQYELEDFERDFRKVQTDLGRR